MPPIKPGPREIVTPRPALSLPIPEGMPRNVFFNSAANLHNLATENGLLRTSEDWLLFRKTVGHSSEFDACIILDKSRHILNPLGRPVRRDQLTDGQRDEWLTLAGTMLDYLVETYPDPDRHLILTGEAALDPTWPLSRRGVPSIRMLHSHFMVFPLADIAAAPLTDPQNPNLTDSGHHGLFLKHLSKVYRHFFKTIDLKLLTPMDDDDGMLSVTGYPKGLPSWHVGDGFHAIPTKQFWHEYELVLRGFLDFYRAFFSLVSTGEPTIPQNLNNEAAVKTHLLASSQFRETAQMIRERIIADPVFANEIRWQPAYKQVLYRDENGRWIVAISQNSVGNAITELLGIVVNRLEDPIAYAKNAPALTARLLEVRQRMLATGIGTAIATKHWP